MTKCLIHRWKLMREILPGIRKERCTRCGETRKIGPFDKEDPFRKPFHACIIHRWTIIGRIRPGVVRKKCTKCGLIEIEDSRYPPVKIKEYI